MKAVYTTPTINRGKFWYIRFIYNGKEIRIKDGLNRIQDLDERELEAKSMMREITRLLRLGKFTIAKNKTSAIVNPDASMGFMASLDFAMQKKKLTLSHKSYLDYDCTVRFVKESIMRLDLDHLNISDVRRATIKTILQDIKDCRKWSNNAYNKNLGYLQAVLSELIEWEIIENNPSHKIKTLAVAESQGVHVPATLEQHIIIKNELQSNHSAFFVYVASIFHTGIRPKELLLIRLSMIDLKSNVITLWPENTKTNRQRIVPINPHFRKYLVDLNLSSYPKHFFLFGKYLKKEDSLFRKQMDFVPAPHSIHRNTATGRWRNIVKIKLGIDVTMYSNKHDGANKKLLAGVSLEAIGELYGHSSMFITKKYATKIHELNRKQIMELSPEY